MESAEAMLIPDDNAGSSAGSRSGGEESSTIQVKNRYILSATASGVMAVDQHRAHVKVLYEQIVGRLAEGSAPSQRIMFPEVFSLTPAQSAVLSDISDRLSGCGFEMSYLGGESWSLSSQPMISDGINPVEALISIIEDYQHARPDDDVGKWRSSVALSLARSGAIKRGQKLSAEERDHLINELLQLPTPNYTPDGKLIISMISADELAAMFR